MATFSHTPYFLSRLTVLPPAVERSPRSESDFLLLPVERADDLRTSFGVPSKSFSVNFSLRSECTEGGPRARGVITEDGSLNEGVADVVGDIRGAVDGGASFFGVGLVIGVMGVIFAPETPADMLGARLGGCVEGTLQLSHSEAEGESLEEGVIEPVVEEPRWTAGDTASASLSSLCSCSRLLRVCPGALSYVCESFGGSGAWPWPFAGPCGAGTGPCFEGVREAGLAVPFTRGLAGEASGVEDFEGGGCLAVLPCGGLSEPSGPSPSV